MLPALVAADTLSGKITAVGTGNLSGAVIRTEGDSNYCYTGTSNATGDYSITTIPANTYNVLVSAPGKAPQRATIVVSGNTSGKNFALRAAPSTGTVVSLPAPLDWGEAQSTSTASTYQAPAAPTDKETNAIQFSNMAMVPTGTDAPMISNWTEIVMPDESFTLTGSKFTLRYGADLGTDTTVWIWGMTSSSTGALRQAKIWRVTENSITATVPADFQKGMYLVWVENQSKASAPICLNKATAVWVGPLGNKAPAGMTSTKRVFGRNITHNHGTTSADYPVVYITPKGGGSYTSCTVTSADPYSVAFTVPSLSTGDYTVYVHNKNGGVYGWSDGLTLTVESAFTRGTGVYNMPAPNGTDDTANLQTAINTANGWTNGGTVQLQTGTYKINGTINLTANVRLLGNGMNSTKLECRLYSPTSAYFSLAGNHVCFEGIEIKACLPQPTNSYALAYFDSSLMPDSFKMTGCRITYEPTVSVWSGGTSGYRTELANCDIYFGWSAGTYDGWIHDSNLYGGSYEGCEAPFCPTVNTVYENCTIKTENWPYDGTKQHPYNYEQNLTYSAYQYMPWAKRVALYAYYGLMSRNTYSANLTGIDVAVEGGVNRGEQFLAHPMRGSWFGQVASNSDRTLTVNQDLFKDTVFTNDANGQPVKGGGIVPNYQGPDYWLPVDGTGWVTILSGKGMGQVNKVVSHTTSTVTVDRPWRVQPDSTSVIVISPEYADHVVYNNNISAFPAGYVRGYSASCGAQIANAYHFYMEGCKTYRTYSGCCMLAHSGGPTNWCMVRGQETHDSQNSGYGAGWDPAYTNSAGAVLIGDSFQSCSANVVGSTYYGGAPYGSMSLRGDGTVAENFTTPDGVKMGYLPSGAATATGAADGFVLYRNGNITTTSFQPDPVEPMPVYFTQMDDGKQFLVGNTYSGASNNYWFEGAIPSLYCQPVALNKVARFKGCKDTLLPDVVVPIANAGIGDMSWTAATSDNWITALVRNNTTVGPESDIGTLTISINPSTLSTGVTWGSITVTGGSRSTKIGVRVELADPIATTSPVAWYKANSLSGSDGTAIGTWTNTGTGSSLNLTQATGSKQPKIYNNQRNGYPVVRFDGTDDALKTTTYRPITGTTNFSTFTVFKYHGTGRYQWPWWEGNSGTSTSYGLFRNDASSAKNKAAWGLTSGTITGTTNIVTDRWYRITTTYNGSAHKMWETWDAGAYFGSAAKTGSNLNTGVLNVGCYYGDTNYLNGDIAELIMYNSALSDADRQSVEAYLAAKYWSAAASFTTSSATGIRPCVVGFNGSGSSSPNGGVTSYSWSFGDGGTGTGATPSHTYNTPGNYNVTLTVTDSTGAYDLCSNPVTLAWPTKVTLSGPTTATAGSVQTLTATQTGGDAGVRYRYLIDRGNGSGFVTLLDWSTNSSCGWTPPHEGTYRFKAQAMEGTTDPGPLPESSVLACSAAAVPTGSNMKLWLRSDVGVVTDAYGRVTQWNDQSSYANNATSSDGSISPAFAGGELNGLPVVRFDGMNDWMSTQNDVLTGTGANGEYAGPFAVFAVLKYAQQPNPDYNPGALPIQIGNDYNRGHSIYCGFQWCRDLEHIESSIYSQPGIPAVVNIGDWYVATGDYKPYYDDPIYWGYGGVDSLWVNGIAKGSDSLAWESRVHGQLWLGGHYNCQFAGDIAEVLVYDSALSDDDRMAVENYLSLKYNIGPTYVGLAASPESPQASPTEVTLTANAVGGTGVKYKFEVDAGSGWSLAQSWSTANTCTWTPPDEGNYTLRCFANQTGSDGDLMTVSSTPFVYTVGTVVPTANLKLWLRADKGITKDVDGQISSWADQSGYANDATQTANSYKPHLVTEGATGMPVVRFDGSSDWIATNDYVLDGTGSDHLYYGPFTLIAVLKYADNQYSSACCPITIGDNYGVGHAVYQAFDWGPGYTPGINNTFSCWDAPLATGMTFGNWYVGAAEYEQLGTPPWYWHSLWVNDVSKGGTSLPYESRVYGQLWLGSGGAFAGDVAEVLVYAAALSDADRQAVDRYLNAKYNFGPVSVSLSCAPDYMTSTDTSATLTATAAGGKSVDYEFMLMGETDSAWSLVPGSSWSSSNTCTWVPAIDGVYKLKAMAKEHGASDSLAVESAAVTYRVGYIGVAGVNSGIAMVMDADTIGLTNGALFSNWADQSGHGHDMTSYQWSSTYNYPTYLTGQINGHSAVRLKTESDYQTYTYNNVMFTSTGTDSPMLTGDVMTAFVVFKERAYVGTDPSTWPDYGDNGIVAFGDLAWGGYSVVVNEYGGYGLNGTADTYQDFYWTGVLSRGAFVPYLQYGIMTLQFNGANSFAKLNGDVEATGDATGRAWAGNFMIGGRPGNLSGRFSELDIASIVIYNRALSSSEENAVGSYLANKYAITTSYEAP